MGNCTRYRCSCLYTCTYNPNELLHFKCVFITRATIQRSRVLSLCVYSSVPWIPEGNVELFLLLSILWCCLKWLPGLCGNIVERSQWVQFILTDIGSYYAAQHRDFKVSCIIFEIFGNLYCTFYSVDVVAAKKMPPSSFLKGKTYVSSNKFPNTELNVCRI